MSKVYEIEFKTMLTTIQYQNLVTEFAEQAKKIVQTNYYFDTPTHQLQNQNIGLRIRVFENSAEQTLKTPAGTGHNLLETTDKLTNSEADELLEKELIKTPSQISKLLPKYQINEKELQIIGKVTTTRFDVELDIGRLAIDQSDYDVATDYELELEVDNSEIGKNNFLHFIAQRQIQQSPKVINKIERMLNYQNN